MQDEYLIVHKSALPDAYEKVVAARELMQTGRAKDVTEAARAVGISRSTFYKYRDRVFRPSGDDSGRKAVFSMLLSHQRGVLSKVLSVFSRHSANVLTLMQSPPVGTRASVVVSVDLAGMTVSPGAFVAQLLTVEGVEQAGLLDIE